MPTAIFTGNDLGRYNKIYRTSDIAKLQDDLSKHINAPVTVPHFNSSDAPLTLDDLAPETLSVLAARLEAEYLHLKGYFANPFITKQISLAA